MLLCFYLTSALAVIATVIALTRSNAAHALVYLVLSMLALAVLFFLLGAPFAAVLHVLIYAGAIMVFYVFVVMMLNLGDAVEAREHSWLAPRAWLVPGILAGLLLTEMLMIFDDTGIYTAGVSVGPKAVGLTLYGPYVLAVEITAMLLMAALVGAYHIARRFIDREGSVR